MVIVGQHSLPERSGMALCLPQPMRGGRHPSACKADDACVLSVKSRRTSARLGIFWEDEYMTMTLQCGSLRGTCIGTELGLMLRVIELLEQGLRPLVRRANLALSCLDAVDAYSPEGVGLLEYHGKSDEQRPLRLDICQSMDAKTIVAELWCPDDLVNLTADTSPASIAIHRRMWRLDPAADPGATVQDVVDEVSTWLDSLPPGTSTGGDGIDVRLDPRGGRVRRPDLPAR